MEINNIRIEHHRNGVCGEPFYVALFDFTEDDVTRPLMAVIFFSDPGYCAVFDVNKLHDGDIRFGSNSWRGDRFEPQLRDAIVKWVGENTIQAKIDGL